MEDAQQNPEAAVSGEENREIVENKQEESQQAEISVETAAAAEIESIPPEQPVEELKPRQLNVEGEKKWYVIQTMSGNEEKVKEALLQTIDLLHLEGIVEQILIPEEEIVELKGKKRIEKKKKMFPGYVFLEMILTDDTWFAIRQTPGVARFIGTTVRPTPVSEREMQRVLKQIGAKEEKLEIAFKKGETVRVISGPFRGYTGIIDEINADKEKLKVLINIFGRDTPVEVNFEHAEKII